MTLNASTTRAPTSAFGDLGPISRKSRVLRAVARMGGGVSQRVAGRRLFPLWGIVRHVGRRSGQPYETPVVIQRSANGFVIPLPFGEATQWARNLVAANGGEIRWRGREYRVVEPTVVEWNGARAAFSPVLRVLAPRTGIRHFLTVRDADVEIAPER